MFTPNVQHIVDELRQEFPTVRIGFWKCRRIDGTLTWSQHAYTQENHLDPDFLGNAADVFPFNMATGDRVAAFLRSEYPGVVNHVLWRVKHHFDHVHFDTWPEGINLPPCKGGVLQVRHYPGGKNGRIGREFTYDFDNAPPPEPEPGPVPLPPQSSEEPLLPITKKSSQQDIGRLQELINEAYYPNHAPGLTVDGVYGNGTAAAVRKWLLPLTNDPDPQVQSGEKVNFREWNQLMKAWILDFLPKPQPSGPGSP